MQDFLKSPKNKTATLLFVLSVVVLVASVFGKINAAPPQGEPGTTFGVIKSDGKNIVISGRQYDSTLPETRVLIIASSSVPGGFPFKIVNPAGDPLFIIEDTGDISIATSTQPENPNIPVINAYSNVGRIYVNGTTITDILKAYNIHAKGTIQADGGFIGNIAGQVSAGNVSAGIFGSNYGYGNFAFGTSSNLGIGTNTQVGLPQRLSVYGGGYFSGRVGISTSTINPEFALSIGDGGGIISKGNLGQGEVLASSGSGTKLIWYPRKAAFRAGYISPGNTQWDDGNIGNNSFAVGQNTLATGAYGATAMGIDTQATGLLAATAMGLHTTASGDNGATSMGYYTTASGESSVSMGNNAEAKSKYSLAVGSFVTADGGSNAIVLGSGPTNAAGSFIGRLTNSATGTLAIGFNSDIPTFVVTRSAGVGTTGNIGIGLSNPQNKLSVSGGDIQIVSAGSGVVFSDGTKQITAANPGNGSNGRMAFWNSTTTLGSNPNFVWDDANARLSIGFNASVAPYSLYATGPIRSNSGVSRFDGDLQVKSTGFLQFEKTQNGAPVATDCDSDTERGRLILDISVNNRLYVCNGAARGWDYLILNN